LTAANAGLAVAQTTLDAYEPELWRLKGDLLLASSVGERRRAQRGRREGKPAAGESDGQEAESCLRRALESACGAQAKSLELRAATSLARFWLSRGRAPEARALLGDVYKWFGARAVSADLAEARILLAETAAAR